MMIRDGSLRGQLVDDRRRARRRQIFGVLIGLRTRRQDRQPFDIGFDDQHFNIRSRIGKRVHEARAALDAQRATARWAWQNRHRPNRTRLSFSLAIDSARLIAQKVLPSLGCAEQIKIRSPCVDGINALAAARGEQQLALHDAELFRKPGYRAIGNDEVIRGQAFAVDLAKLRTGRTCRHWNMSRWRR